MEGHSVRAPVVAGIGAAVALLAGCSASSSLLPAGTPPAAGSRGHARGTAGYVYVSNRTPQGASQLLVYPAETQDPSPLLTVTRRLGDADGVAVDSSGNVYVANGSAGNVLEFAPGGTSLVRTYSQDLVDPVSVAVSNDTLYVADRGNASNGFLQQVLEFTVGSGTASMGIAGIGNYPQINEGIAVDPLQSSTFYATATMLGALPPASVCNASGGYSIGEDLMPTLWMLLKLSHNKQADGLAFDASGNLYVSDVCANDVEIYRNDSGHWVYSGRVDGTFTTPMLLTIDDQMLAIPSAGTPSGGGYVTVIDLTKGQPTVKITNGITRPVAAAVSI